MAEAPELPEKRPAEGEQTDAPPAKRRRANRWSEDVSAPVVLSTATAATVAALAQAPIVMTLNGPQPAVAPEDAEQLLRAVLLQRKAAQDAANKVTRLSELTIAILTNDFTRVLPANKERSPSPPPTYDGQGKRTNTRELRYRARFMAEKETLEAEVNLSRPVPKPLPTKKSSEKIMVPVNDFPAINFVGALIGPRGSVVKRVQQETGANVSVRGVGATKDGIVRPKNMEGMDEPLHVFIQGTPDQVAKAKEEVEAIIETAKLGDTPERMKQLELVAKLNGTWRGDAFYNSGAYASSSIVTTSTTAGAPAAKTDDPAYRAFLEAVGETKAAPPPLPPGPPPAPVWGAQSAPPPPTSLAPLMSAPTRQPLAWVAPLPTAPYPYQDPASYQGYHDPNLYVPQPLQPAAPPAWQPPPGVPNGPPGVAPLDPPQPVYPPAGYGQQYPQQGYGQQYGQQGWGMPPQYGYR